MVMPSFQFSRATFIFLDSRVKVFSSSEYIQERLPTMYVHSLLDGYLIRNANSLTFRVGQSVFDSFVFFISSWFVRQRNERYGSVFKWPHRALSSSPLMYTMLLWHGGRERTLELIVISFRAWIGWSRVRSFTTIFLDREFRLDSKNTMIRVNYDLKPLKRPAFPFDEEDRFLSWECMLALFYGGSKASDSFFNI